MLQLHSCKVDSETGFRVQAVGEGVPWGVNPGTREGEGAEDAEEGLKPNAGPGTASAAARSCPGTRMASRVKEWGGDDGHLYSGIVSH